MEVELDIRPHDHIARAGGRVLPLSQRELDVLATLAETPDRVLTRAELYRRVWGRDLRAEDRTVDVYVHRLRTKLARAVPGWEFIHTHFGLGYRFTPERSRSFHTRATAS